MSSLYTAKLLQGLNVISIALRAVSLLSDNRFELREGRDFQML